MDPSEVIECRPATHRDCDPTMDINRNVYGGLDYLQYRFHNFIDNPLRFPFVAVLDGLVVGYKCGYVIDDGTSLVSAAVRVHPDHQGKGIMSKLDRAVMAAALERFPCIQRTIWTAVDLERTMYKVNKEPTAKLITQRPRVGFDSTCEDLQHLCSSSKFHSLLEKYKVSDISAVPRRHAIDILTHHTDFAAAVPEGALLVNFEPWGLQHQTYIELLKTCTLHVSHVGGSSQVSSAHFPTGKVLELTRDELPSSGNCPKLTESDPSSSINDPSSTRNDATLRKSGMPQTGSDISSTENDPPSNSRDPSQTNSKAMAASPDRDSSVSKCVSCFSFHSVTPSAVGARCRADFYCSADENATKVAAAHLLYHIREFAECNQGTDVSFGMLFSELIDKPALKRILTDELGLDTSTTPESSGLLVSMPYTAE